MMIKKSLINICINVLNAFMSFTLWLQTGSLELIFTVLILFLGYGQGNHISEVVRLSNWYVTDI